MKTENFRPHLAIEDDECIRKKKKSEFRISMRGYKILKAVLLAAVPVAYFVWSQLLFPVFAALAATLILAGKKEKQFNKGLKKELHSHLPKGDGILALLVIAVTVVGIVFSVSFSAQKKSVFEGFDETEIEEVVKNEDFGGGRFVWMQIKNQLHTLGNLSTGERVLFKETRRFGMMGGGMPPKMPEGGTELREPPQDMSEILKDMPFEILFSSVLKSVNAGLVLLVFGVGAVSLWKIRKAED